MSESRQVTRRYTFEEYLKLEETAEYKSEFFDGEIVAMAGGTYRSSQIEQNLSVVLDRLLRSGPCKIHGTNLRVRAIKGRRYFYPDKLVLCEPPQFDERDRKQTTITNPKVVFEILSESSEAYDRGKKFLSYLEIDTLEEYVLISQDEPRVDVFLRQSDGSWRFTHFVEPAAAAALDSLGIKLLLHEIYEGVEFSPESEPPIADDI